MVKTKDHLGYIITERFANDQPIHEETRSVHAPGNMLDRKFKFCCDETKETFYIPMYKFILLV